MSILLGIFPHMTDAMITPSVGSGVYVAKTLVASLTLEQVLCWMDIFAVTDLITITF